MIKVRKILFVLSLLIMSITCAAQSITLTGVGKSCQTGKYSLPLIGGGRWDYVRNNFGGVSFYSKDPTTADLYVQSYAVSTTIKRFGVLFNTNAVHALGDIIITSISLRLYSNSASSNVGTTIYAAPYTFAGVDTYQDYIRIVGAKSVLAYPPFEKITHSLTTASGYNTFSLGTVYTQSEQYSNMVSYGVGEYEHDYLDVEPGTSVYYELEFAINEMVTSGALIVGAFYMITDNSGGADFTTAGAPDNNVGTTWTYVSGGYTWGTGELYKNPPQLIINYTTTPAPTATDTKTTFIIQPL